eukprot:SAG31_NODE_9048_length_1343_cov_1.081190_1_plen_150_part_00
MFQVKDRWPVNSSTAIETIAASYNPVQKGESGVRLFNLAPKDGDPLDPIGLKVTTAILVQNNWHMFVTKDCACECDRRCCRATGRRMAMVSSTLSDLYGLMSARPRQPNPTQFSMTRAAILSLPATRPRLVPLHFGCLAYEMATRLSVW